VELPNAGQIQQHRRRLTVGPCGFHFDKIAASGGFDRAALQSFDGAAQGHRAASRSRMAATASQSISCSAGAHFRSHHRKPSPADTTPARSVREGRGPHRAGIASGAGGVELFTVGSGPHCGLLVAGVWRLIQVG